MERTGGELAKIMSDLLRRAPAAEAPVLAWPAVCGQAVAARTQALHFASGRLRVEVPDLAWRTQLAQLEMRYCSQFVALLGSHQVRQIEFIIAGTGTAPRDGKMESISARLAARRRVIDA